MPGPVGEAPPTTSPHRQSALLDEMRIMPSSGVVRGCGVSQRLRRETHHLGFSCLPDAVGTVGWLFSPVCRKNKDVARLVMETVKGRRALAP